jgi:Halobacterial output domain 1
MGENSKDENSKDEYRTQIEEDEHVSEAVLRAIAAVANRPILELPPLADSIDLDSLDRLFAASPPGSLQFTYEGYRVTIEPSHVHIRKQQ